MKLLTKKIVAAKIGFSLAHLDRLRFDPAYAYLGFPVPVRIGYKVLWSEAEVDSWIELQLDRRRLTAP
jgi:predicted DNA-binding transcriptional regulator AlpA